jgi:hypothetical protein
MRALGEDVDIWEGDRTLLSISLAAIEVRRWNH